MSFVVVRKLDNAVIGHNSTSLNPQPLDSFYEVEKNPPPVFMPHWSINKWLYVVLTDSFLDTGTPMTW